MKKIISIFLICLLMITSLAACQKKDDNGQTVRQSGQASSTAVSSAASSEAASSTAASEASSSSASTEASSQAQTKPEPVKEEVDESKLVTKKATDTVNVRMAADINSQVVKKITRGTEVSVISTDGKWAKVYMDKNIYYIASDYLKDPSEVVDEPVKTPDTKPLPSGGGSNSGAGYTVVIDAGHQARGNSSKEPIGPGASETKAKVTTGTSGSTTGLTESKLTLQVALKLQAELESRGYNVIMCRTSNDVDISNAERAQIANNANADAFIRLHANGSNDSSVNGALTMCQSSSNPYNGNLASQSYALSAAVLNNLTAVTDLRKRGVSLSDNMSGINWCQVPVTIVEMGFMSNPSDDTYMADADNQYRMAVGIANGIDEFLQ